MSSYAVVIIPIFCVLIVIGNASTILAFLIKKRLRRNPSYWYITSLAASDVLIGSITIPLHLYARSGYFGPVDRTFSEMPTDTTCNILLSSYVMTVAPHIHHLMVLSIDRYIKLTSPLWYRRVMTIKVAMVILAIIWIMGAVVNIFLILPDHIYVGDCLSFRMKIFSYRYDHCYIATILVVHVPCLFLIICNVRVYMIATKYKEAIERELLSGKSTLNDRYFLRYHRGKVIVENAAPIKRHQNLLNCHKNQENNSRKSNSSHTSVSVNTSSGSNNSVELMVSRKMKDWLSATVRQKKIVLLISTIVGASIGCWFPTTAVHMLRWCSTPEIMSFMAESTIELIHPWLGYFNSLLNPIILLLMNEDFRSSYKQIYRIRTSVRKPS